MRRSFDVTIAMAACASALFLLAPLVMVFLNSIGDGLFPTFPPVRFSLTPYLEIPPRWLVGLAHSLQLALASALLACLLGTMSALALVRGNLRHRVLIDAVLRSPLQIPSLVLGIAFLQYVAWLSQATGLDLRGSFLALLIAHSAVAIPFVLTIVTARLSSFDVRLEEAAQGLGATPLAAFMLVTLPNISSAVLSGSFFAFLLSLDNVPLSLFLVSSSFNLLPVDLFTAIQFGLTRTIYAVSTLVCVGTSILIVIFYTRATSFAVIRRM